MVAQVGRQALFQQAAEHVGIPLAGHIEHLFGKFRCFVFSHLLWRALIRHIYLLVNGKTQSHERPGCGQQR
ncbi:hypothetical protein D3C80_1559210 [compost metagenome]